ncbi:MAG: hypothetical protein RJA76_663 [Bacteroidota bacterium]|jgi:uncharacterized membrane protein
MKHLSASQERIILEAIQLAERKTSGEIRVHLESHCEGHPVGRAEVLFHYLGMDKTDLQNGVLFYLAIKDRKFAIIGDKAIDAKVPHEFWETIRDEMRPLLASNQLELALELGINRAGEALAIYFPFHKDDVNELTDEISYGN